MFNLAERKKTRNSSATAESGYGVDSAGLALNDGEIFNPQTQSFRTVTAAVLNNQLLDALPILVASIPLNRSIDVPTDSMVSLRFSTVLRGDTVNPDTVTLTGPRGVEAIKVVPAEGGILAFIEPELDFLPGATYSVTVNGALDRLGRPLPLSGISFTTRGLALGQTSGSVAPGGTRPAENQPGKGDNTSDHWIWKGERRNGKPYSPWQDEPALRARPGITALSGQVLQLNGEPLPNVTIEIASTHGSRRKGTYGHHHHGSVKRTRTDSRGRFLLTDVPTGHQVINIDGKTAGRPGRTYGFYHAGVEVAAGETNILPFTIWLPETDMDHAVRIPSPTTEEIIITTPRLPGLEIHIPPGTVIRDTEGNTVTWVSITPIPTDRTPHPLPEGLDPPYFFTVQPGGSILRAVDGTKGRGFRTIAPNYQGSPPGTKIDFWSYDPSGESDYEHAPGGNYHPVGPGWFVAGQGTVSDDGKRIIPDPGLESYELMCYTLGYPGEPEGPKCTEEGQCGDPVDLYTGIFLRSETDLFIPDVIPIDITRTYRSKDGFFFRPFGSGGRHPYQIFIVGDQAHCLWAELILPDGEKVRYDRTSGYANCIDPPSISMRSRSTPGRFYDSILSSGHLSLSWTIHLKDGTRYEFFVQGSGSASKIMLFNIYDRHGNVLKIDRDANSRILKITSPSNRWVEFQYDGNTQRVIKITDNIGREVNYQYYPDGPVSPDGPLWKVTNAEGEVTEYTYDTLGRMETVKNPRGIVILRNEYSTDQDWRVTRQIIAEGTPDESTFQFTYTKDPVTGKVTQVDVTNPRGFVNRRIYNAKGQTTSVIRALGTPEQTTTIYERDAETNLLNATVDSIGRRTEFTYDSRGNVLTTTRLAGTSDAKTTSFTYAFPYSQITSTTDPSGRVTEFTLDAKGNAVKTQDHLGNITTFQYDPGGRQTAMTGVNGTDEFIYEGADLVEIKDSQGNTTRRFYDEAGRVLSETAPNGLRTFFELDKVDRLKKITDPSQNTTQFGYDPNGNLTSVTDARNNTTVYVYDNQDRLKTRKDPLLREALWL